MKPAASDPSCALAFVPEANRAATTSRPRLVIGADATTTFIVRSPRSPSGAMTLRASRATTGVGSVQNLPRPPRGRAALRDRPWPIPCGNWLWQSTPSLEPEAHAEDRPRQLDVVDEAVLVVVDLEVPVTQP